MQTELKQIFKLGQKITILRIDDMMAMTHMNRMTVQTLKEQPSRGGCQGCLVFYGTAVPQGKRKGGAFALGKSDIVFDGWDLPFQTDGDAVQSGKSTIKCIRGNACYNLVGAPSVIKAYLETKALLPVQQSDLARVLVINGDHELVLYPENYSGHPVIEQLNGIKQFERKPAAV